MNESTSYKHTHVFCFIPFDAIFMWCILLKCYTLGLQITRNVLFGYLAFITAVKHFYVLPCDWTIKLITTALHNMTDAFSWWTTWVVNVNYNSHFLASFWSVPQWPSPLRCLHLRWCGNSCCRASSSFLTVKLLKREQARILKSSIVCVAFHWRAGLAGLLCVCRNTWREIHW